MPFRNHCETWYRDASGKGTWYSGSQWPFNIEPRHRRLSVVSLGIHRELIDQAIIPGVAITTPHAMAVEVMLEGTEVMVNVSSPLRFACSLHADCRLFALRQWSASNFVRFHRPSLPSV